MYALCVPSLPWSLRVLRVGQRGLGVRAGAGDRLDAGGDVDVAVAGADRVGADADRVQARRAVARDRRAGDRVGQLLATAAPRCGRCCRPARPASCRSRTTTSSTVAGSTPVVAVEQLVDRVGDEVVGADRAERPLERAPDGRANGVDDYCFWHWISSPGGLWKGMRGGAVYEVRIPILTRESTPKAWLNAVRPCRSHRPSALVRNVTHRPAGRRTVDLHQATGGETENARRQPHLPGLHGRSGFFAIAYGLLHAHSAAASTRAPYGKLYSGAPGAHGPGEVSGHDPQMRRVREWSRGCR